MKKTGKTLILKSKTRKSKYQFNENEKLNMEQKTEKTIKFIKNSPLKTDF
ncbi:MULTISPECIES: hypothetical protein [Photorhabdus]|uniref:Uncharacterized protein n=1 Tax=Photorhabdus asymbiotica TaxID=291112 RepID=A0ABX9SLC4_9GAMM|nr:hypothetical protein [Photorhabdus asymbiotica]RKS56584.1 hypothetical protein BDD30_3206 [Photorhabdus asymbiotica]